MFKKDIIFAVLLVIIGCIPLLDLLHPDLPITHDGQDHVARIGNFYKNLQDGNLIPRWAPNLNWGFGHPILMFLYPLPSYAASLFHFLGFSLVDGVKLVFGVAFLASGLAMYIWAKNALGELAGFVAAVVYMFTPYRFVDLYIRGAIGEHVAFVFPPLIFYFLFKLKNKYSLWYIVGGSLCTAGLILSHNAISLMFLPLIFFYAFVLFKDSNKKKRLVYQYTSILVLGFGLSAFFWLPALIEGKYTLRYIVTAGGYIDRFVEPLALLYGPWNYGISGQFSVQIGIVNIIGLLFAPIFFLKNKKERLFVAGLFLYSLFAIFLMLSESSFIWQRLTILQNFQFPWRLLSVLVFTSSVLVGYFLRLVPKKLVSYSSVIIILLVLFFNKDYWYAKGYLQNDEIFFTGIYDSTTDTGESSPIWSVRFMEKRPNAHLEAIEGRSSIKEVKRTSTLHLYEVQAEGKSRLRENTLYFPGWEVLVDGRVVPLEFQDPRHRGLMTFFVPEGKHVVAVSFGETRLRQSANLISLASIICIVGITFIRKRKNSFNIMI